MLSIIDFLYTVITTICTPVVIIFIILLISFFVAKGKKTKIILTIGFICMYAVSSGAISNLLLKKLQNYPPISTKEIYTNKAIILLGAGLDKQSYGVLTNILANSRILETLRIYSIAKAHGINYKIIISGGDPKHYGQSEADTYAKLLVQLGVPKKDLVIENKSLNTYQNAKYVGQKIKDLPYKKYILVTSSVHMKRSVLYFKHFGINVIPAISEATQPMMWLPTSYNILLMDLAVHEYLSIFRFYLYNYFNLNNNSPIPFSKAGQ